MRRTSTIVAALFVALAAVPARADDPGPAAEANRRLGRGINLGNALEAPKEGEWGMTLEAGYFDIIRQAGFDTVRIPVKWSAHAAREAPYTIDPKFFERVDWALDQAQRSGLNAVLNVHHYDEMDARPEEATPRFLALWRQIADRYKGRPASVYFELLNEPHDKLTDDLWNRIHPKALEAVRATNPTRAVIVGPGMWNGIGSLPKLELPELDRRLIVTFHDYNPFPFTHQGAEWLKDKAPPVGVTWEGTPEQLAALRRDLDKAAAWGKAHDRPLFLGEFGVYSKADMASRARWTAAMTREAEARGIAWAYWEFGAGFGAYDRAANAWRAPLLEALVPPGPRRSSP